MTVFLGGVLFLWCYPDLSAPACGRGVGWDRNRMHAGSYSGSGTATTDLCSLRNSPFMNPLFFLSSKPLIFARTKQHLPSKKV